MDGLETTLFMLHQAVQKEIYLELIIADGHATILLGLGTITHGALIYSSLSPSPSFPVFLLFPIQLFESIFGEHCLTYKLNSIEIHDVL